MPTRVKGPILLMLLYCSVWGGKTAHAQVMQALSPETQQSLHLSAGQEQTLPLRIPAGQVIDVSFRRVQGSVQASWTIDGHTPDARKSRSNRDGRLSSIKFHAVGFNEDSPSTGSKTKDGPGDVVGSFKIQNRGKWPAEVEVIAGALRSPTSVNGLELRAERDMDEAAAASNDRTAEGARKSLALLESAEQEWRAAGEKTELARTIALESFTEAFPLNDGVAASQRLPELVSLAAQIVSTDVVEAANGRKTAAFVYAKQARYDEALQQYNDALVLFEKTADLYNCVVVRENRAKVERIQGHNDLALADVEAAIPLAQKNNDSPESLHWK